MVFKNLQERLNYLENFAQEVKFTRKLQKEYFKTRDTDVLNKAKVQEKRIDDMLELLNNRVGLQGKVLDVD